jgi:hypothetical protein
MARDGGLLLFGRSTNRVTHWNGGLELMGTSPIPSSDGRFDVRMDGSGRIFFTDPPATSPLYLSPGDRPGRPPDSSLIYRRDPSTGRVDTLGSVLIAGAEWIGRVGKFPRRFDAQDLWGITAAGVLWIARAKELRVDLLMPDGRWIHGAPNEWTPVPTGLGDVRMMRNPAAAEPDSIPWPTASEKPAFHSAVADPDGSVWVAMSHPAGHQVQDYRVFDPTGRLLPLVLEFPPDSRVLAVGSDVLYVATRDDHERITIHRYPRPDR